MTHQVDIDPEQLDQAFAAFEQPALPPPGGEGAGPAPEPERSDWSGFAEMVAKGLPGFAPNWEIGDDRAQGFAEALARFLDDVAPFGPGNPAEWPSWLHLGFAAGTIVVVDGWDWQRMRMKPLTREAQAALEAAERGEDPPEPAGPAGGFSTLSDPEAGDGG